MRVTILGSGTSIPHPKRASPGLIVQFDRSTILVDPSAGSLHRAAKTGVFLQDVDCVLFSHYHLDHTGDLGPLLFALKNPKYFGSKKIFLAGPTGLIDLHQGFLDFYGSWVELGQQRLTIREIRNDELDFEDGTIQALPVLHTENSLGYRFSDNRRRVFTYSGDSDYCQTLLELSRGADVALIEASQPSEMKMDGHLTPQLAGKIAREAGVKRLVITHLYPVCDGYDLIAEVQSSGYKGSSEIAWDGMVIDI